MNKLNILVTGANGFIGKELVLKLRSLGFEVRCAFRNKKGADTESTNSVYIGDISDKTDWGMALNGIDVVIHLAGFAHIKTAAKQDRFDALRKVNVHGSRRLAQMAAAMGVKRFIFLSSIKVNGEKGVRPFTEKDPSNPQDAYAISKWEAENAVFGIAKNTGMEVVILRTPLVYGQNVKANFKDLIKIAFSGMPLPLKGINNKRSFIYVGNLVDAISVCVFHPAAANEVFLLSDCQDISTPALIKLIAAAGNKKARLFFMHPCILRFLAKTFGKAESWDKLTSSLLIDSAKFRNLLHWSPPFTLEEGIKQTLFRSI